MKIPRTPLDEPARLRALRELLILDTRTEDRFDGFTAYCRVRFRVDVALITLVDAERQWFKSAAGLGIRETSRDVSFCGHAILQEDVLMVRDTHLDDRFADNPLVTRSPFIRFYAGAPLTISSGHRVGTLCLIHSRPLSLPAEEIFHLRELAAAVSLELEQHGPGAPALKGSTLGKVVSQRR
jgi:GAF domain-containing protein